MGVTALLRRFAAGVPQVLVAEAPGGTASRLAVEQLLRRWGWVQVSHPADADVLAVVGPAGPQWTSFADQLWDQVPQPRVRVQVGNAAEADIALQRAASLLTDQGEAPPVGEGMSARRGRDGAGHAEHGRSDDQSQGHEQHGGGGMDMPGGVPMADRGPDRDGLMLDQLHVPLGPVLPDWPAGLVLHTTLQGDVVQRARLEVIRDYGDVPDFWNEPWRRSASGEAVTAGEAARRRAAAHLDSLARLLAVAGWRDAALRGRRARDDVLAGVPAEVVARLVHRLVRWLRRSRTLRWLTGGLGVLPAEAAEAAGVTGPTLMASRAGGDVRARWQAWLAEIERSVPAFDDGAPLTITDSGPRGRLGAGGCSAAALGVLSGLVEGAELAGARLIVASLDPDIAELDHVDVGAVDG
ncbi:hypothetical protein INP57_18465 [Saccharopolyspora sp. HNM0986]|uniref:hypothetical protein n=1 Tax=Saccharopolyspora galaxeae TaxID=2781241 RepID=UPI00190C66BB|nr:hypothetical protein [Saccharopolyspora sp. HNM0986]MBK0868795.1 hypothetical protein [Saccharopolyspora sp. HNM0986]